MKICENCNKKHNGKYGSGRFCSVKCSRSFSTKAKRSLINESVSKKLLNNQPKIKKICPQCLLEFEVSPSRKKQKCCSTSCATKLRGGWNNHDKVNWSEVNKKTYADGRRIINGGTTKWYDYKGIRIQGTFELRTCQILDIWKYYNIIKDWEYTKDRVEYTGEDGKKHSYLLDFKIYTNENFFYYIEVKGYETPNDILKWKSVREKGSKLEVWFEKDIIKIEEELGV